MPQSGVTLPRLPGLTLPQPSAPLPGRGGLLVRDLETLAVDILAAAAVQRFGGRSSEGQGPQGQPPAATQPPGAAVGAQPPGRPGAPRGGPRGGLNQPVERADP